MCLISPTFLDRAFCLSWSETHRIIYCIYTEAFLVAYRLHYFIVSVYILKWVVGEKEPSSSMSIFSTGTFEDYTDVQKFTVNLHMNGSTARLSSVMVHADSDASPGLL